MSSVEVYNHDLELLDLLYTLEICKKNLPADAHPIHYIRLEKLERLLKNLK